MQEYLNKSFNIDYNNSATIIITVFIFLCGLIFQLFFNYIKIYYSKKRTRKFFKYSVNEFHKKVSNQADEYKRISKSLKFNSDYSFDFKRTTISSIGIFQTLNQEKTFDSYFVGFDRSLKCNRKLKLKAFNKVWGAINSVEFWHDNSFSNREQFISKYNLLNDKRNTSIEKLRQLLEVELFKYNKKSTDAVSDYIKKYDLIFQNWQTLNDRTRPDIIHRQLILRIRILNRKYQHFELVDLTNNLLLEASFNYLELRTLLRITSDEFLHHYFTFKESATISKKGIVILNC